MRGKLHLSFFCSCLLGLVLLGNIFNAQKLSAQSVPASSALPRLISLQANLPENGESANLTALLRQGQDFYNSGHFSEAIKVLQYVADVFKNQGDYSSQGATLANLSLAYQQLGQWDEAEKAIADSINLLNTNPGDRRYSNRIAQVWEIAGKLKLSIGKPEEALKLWQDAAEIYHKLQAPIAANRNTVNQSIALQELGQHRQALKTLIDLLPRLQQQPDLLVKAIAWRNLANVLRVVGEVPELENYGLPFTKLPDGKKLTYLDRAKQLLTASIEITDELQLPQESNLTRFILANTFEASYQRLKNAAERIGSPSKKKNALEEAQEALKYYQKVVTDSKNNQIVRVQAQLNHLALSLKTQEIKEFSGNDLLKITSEINLLPASRAAIYGRINLIKSLMTIAKESENKSQFLLPSVNLLTDAIQQAHKLGDRHTQAYAMLYLGKLYEQNGQFKEATNSSLQALSITEELQTKDVAYQLEWQLGRLAQKQADKKQAIAYYRQAIKSLGIVRHNLSSLPNPEVQFSFRDDAEPIYRELVGLLLSGLESEVSQANLKEARSIIEDLQVAELENYLRCQLSDSKPIELDKVIQTHNLNTAVIYPIVLEDRLEVILKLPEKSELIRYTTPISKIDLEIEINKLQKDIDERKTANNPKEKTSFSRMYDLLLQKAEPYLKNHHLKVDTLLFVLDGSLQNVPMASLYDGNSYLIEKYSIALNLGLQLVDAKPLEKENFNVLVAGLSAEVNGNPALSYVEEEVKVIPHSTVLLNSDFTFNTLQQKINSESFSAVHLATHGLFSSDPEETFILAYDQEINVHRLINLLRSQQQNQPNPIKLLVLSACQTAKGDKWAGLGIAGIAVRSGARSTIASLSNVPDKSTAKMMSYFYEELGKPGVTEAKALSSAQKKMLENSEYKKPFYWSSFVLLGSW